MPTTSHKPLSDYRGILSGLSWVSSVGTLKATKKPVFLTYSFPTSMPADDRETWPEKKNDWQAFSGNDKADARAALKQWGNASGIRFLEVKKDHGDIQFSWLLSDPSHSAFAFYPSNDSPYGVPDTHTHLI